MSTSFVCSGCSSASHSVPVDPVIIVGRAESRASAEGGSVSGATALPPLNPSLPSSCWDPGRDGMRRIRCSGFISAGLQLESIPLKWQQKADGGGRLTPDVRGVQTDRGGGGALGPNRTHPNLSLRTCLWVKDNCLMRAANSSCRDRTFLLLLHS